LNGTFVGGCRVETAPLSPGDLLTIGTVTLRVIYGEAGDQTAAGRMRADKSNVMVGAVDTISLEDTTRAARLPDDDDEFGDILD
jgi:hypothetical protein